MIGNDVIDLSLAKHESSPFRKGYLEKTCSKNERDYILNYQNPEFAFWKLWSRKEAVYKLLRQLGATRGYYPIRIENTNPELGWVTFEERTYYTKTFYNGECMHTIALQSPECNDFIDLDNSIKIFKKGEIPFLNFGNKTVPISKSHHGRFEKIVALKKDLTLK